MNTPIPFSWPSASQRQRPNRASLFGVLITSCLLIFLAGCSPKMLRKPAAGHKVSVSSKKLMMGSPATSLEIHHININNGDASVIRVLHADGTETKVLIDGGQTASAFYLLPYCNAVFQNNQFKYIVLTHYHNDHYNGLMALGNGTIRGDYYIDLGGYNMRNYATGTALPLIQPRDTTCPWTDSIGIFEGTSMGAYVTAVGNAAQNYGLKRYAPMTTTSDRIGDLIGVVVPVDTFISGTQKIPISLRCVALWGYTMGANGVATDNWNRGASKNDPCIAFVLECGEFRYFFGGDMGGHQGGSYIDQETTLSAGLQYLYKGSKSFFNPGTAYDGHVCGFKADHHGSDHSNNSTFLNTMRPAVCVTSAGDNQGWHLPSIGFLNRLNAAPSVTPATSIPNSEPRYLNAQGFLFTNLTNFLGGFNSLSVADSLFGNRPRTAYQYGNTATNPKAGYIVGLQITNSAFLTGTVWYNLYSVDKANYSINPISHIVCHQK